MILAIALDPFSQQLVQLDSHMVYHDGVISWGGGLADSESIASNARAVAYVKGSVMGDHADTKMNRYTIDPGMESAVLDGMFTTSAVVQRRLQVNCSTSDCQWDSFSTLGVCHRCNDVTSQLKKIPNWATFVDASKDKDKTAPSSMTAYFLPNGAFLANVDQKWDSDGKDIYLDNRNDLPNQWNPRRMMAYNSANPNSTLGMKNVRTLIWATTAVSLDLSKFNYDIVNGQWPTWPDVPVVANECALYYCALDVSGAMTNGTMHETTKESSTLKLTERTTSGVTETNNTALASYPDDSLLSDIGGGYVQFSTDVTGMGLESATLELSFDTGLCIAQYFHDNLAASANVTDHQIRSNTMTVQRTGGDMPVGRANMANFANVFNQPEENDPIKTVGIWDRRTRSLEGQYQRIAQAMTIEMRNSGGLDTNDPTAFVQGRTGALVTVYSIRWAWFSFHVALLVAGLVFCIVTMAYATRKRRELDLKAWKNNSLAIISKAPQLGSGFEPSDEVWTLEDKARRKTNSFTTKEGDGLVSAASVEDYASDEHVEGHELRSRLV